MALVAPVLAQIFWTFLVILMAGRSRVSTLRAREVSMGQIALGNDAWPQRVKALGNNMNNQFETPVLFYALCGIATYLGLTGWVMAALAWGYVASRVAHTLIHTGGNNVPRRFQAFVAGLTLLMAMWLGILLRLLGLI